jgi:hypothetical protein
MKRYFIVLFAAMLLISGATAEFNTGVVSDNGNQASVVASGTEVGATGSASADDNSAEASAAGEISGGFVTTSASSDGNSASTTAGAVDGTACVVQGAEASEEGAVAGEVVFASGEGLSAETTATNSEGDTATASAEVGEGCLVTGQVAAAGDTDVAGLDVDGAVAAQSTFAAGEDIEVVTEASTDGGCKGPDAEATAEAEVGSGVVKADQVAAAGTISTDDEKARNGNFEVTGAVAAQDTFAAGSGVEVETEASYEGHRNTEANAEAEAKVEQGAVDSEQFAVAGKLEMSPVKATGAIAGQETFAVGQGIEVETEANYEGHRNTEANAEAEVEVRDGFAVTKQTAGAGSYEIEVDPAGSFAEQDTYAQGSGINVKTESETQFGRHKEYEAGTVAGVWYGSVDALQTAHSDTDGSSAVQGTTVKGLNGYAKTWSEAEGCFITPTGEKTTTRTHEMEAETGAFYFGSGDLTTIQDANAGDHAGGYSSQEDKDIKQKVEAQTYDGVDAGQKTTLNGHFVMAYTNANNGDVAGAEAEAGASSRHGTTLATMQWAGLDTQTELAGQVTTFDGGHGWAETEAHDAERVARATFYESDSDVTVQNLAKSTWTYTKGSNLWNGKAEVIQDAEIVDGGYIHAESFAKNLRNGNSKMAYASIHGSGYESQYANPTYADSLVGTP